VETALEHFSIVTYSVETERLRPLVHPRFVIDEIEDASGRRVGLVSAVTFRDRDFRLAALGWPRWQFGQTNYRSYVTDSQTGQHVAWFFVTVLERLGLVAQGSSPAIHSVLMQRAIDFTIYLPPRAV